MACGDTIAPSLLVAHGMTVDEPCEYFCSSGDVDAWNIQAWAVATMVGLAFTDLLTAEADNGLPPDLSSPIQSTLDIFDERMVHIEAPGDAQLMPSYAFGGFGTSIGAIRRDQQAIAVGACALEQINAALGALSSAGYAGISVIPIVAPPMPSPESGLAGIPWYVWAGAGALLIGGVYLAGRVA